MQAEGTVEIYQGLVALANVHHQRQTHLFQVRILKG